MHPNVERLESFLDAYAARDVPGLRDCLADDAVWHVGGTHRLSGDYQGIFAILEYFEQVGEETGGTLQLEHLELSPTTREAPPSFVSSASAGTTNST